MKWWNFLKNAGVVIKHFCALSACNTHQHNVQFIGDRVAPITPLYISVPLMGPPILFGAHCMIIILLFELQMQADSPYNFFVHG